MYQLIFSMVSGPFPMVRESAGTFGWIVDGEALNL
jgi:hypothetical protein